MEDLKACGHVLSARDRWNEIACSTPSPPLPYRQEVSCDKHETKYARPGATRAIRLNPATCKTPPRSRSTLPSPNPPNAQSHPPAWPVSNGNKYLLSLSWISFPVSNSDGDDEVLVRRGLEDEFGGAVAAFNGKEGRGQEGVRSQFSKRRVVDFVVVVAGRGEEAVFVRCQRTCLSVLWGAARSFFCEPLSL
jgi:hypothetical protein